MFGRAWVNMMNFSAFFLFSLIFLTTPSFAASFKCWTNKEGIKECGNSIPPEYSNQRIQYHSSRSGQVERVKEAAKTKEQLEQEKKQKKLSLVEQRKIAKQKAYDDVLLKTYLSIDDLMLSLRWKITTLDSRIKVAKGTISSQQDKFLTYNNQAANAERQGREIPKDVKENLNDSRDNIQKQKQLIKMLESEKTSIREKFTHDIERFTIARTNGLGFTLSDDERAFNIYSSQIQCSSNDKCSYSWDKAKQFVNEHGDYPIAYDTDVIYSTKSSEEGTKLAMHVSLIDSIESRTKSDKKITLQIRCHPSSEGEKTCKSDKVFNLLVDFKKLEL